MGSIWAGQLQAQAPDEFVAFTGTGMSRKEARRAAARPPARPQTPAADADETLPVGPAPRAGGAEAEGRAGPVATMLGTGQGKEGILPSWASSMRA